MHPKVLGEYKISKTLGEGAFSKVKLGIYLPSGEKVAIKIIDKKRMREAAEISAKDKKVREQKRREKLESKGLPAEMPETPFIDHGAAPQFLREMENEVKLLVRLNHPNVIKTFQVIDSPEESYVVMQCAAGGDMTEYLATKGNLDEDEARKYFRQLISGVDHCHLANVVHRDLKLENLLLDENSNILISDFGLGRTFDQKDYLKTFCGTPNYAACELICGIPYKGEFSDIWAMGIILYALCVGSPPFKGKTISILYDNIKNCKYKAPATLSNDLKDLFSKIFVPNPSQRIDMNKLREHPWVNKNFTQPPERIQPKYTSLSDESVSKQISGINYDGSYTIYTFEAINKKQFQDNFNQAHSRVNSSKLERKSSFLAHTESFRHKSISAGPSIDNELGTKSAGAVPYSASSGASGVSGVSGTSTNSPTTNGKLSAGTSQEPSMWLNQKEYSFVESEEPGTNSINLPSGSPASISPLRTRPRSRSYAPPRNTRAAPRPAGVNGPSILGNRHSSTDAERSSDNMVSPLRSSALLRRMSMVTAPEDSLASSQDENLNINMDDITQWHQIHMPPSEIRSIKFIFNSKLSSSTLEPSSMFQELHYALMQLEECVEKKLTFKRNPKFYLLTCVCETEGEPLKFEIELCNLWLTKTHALRIKKKSGDSLLFKSIHDRIIDFLSWK